MPSLAANIQRQDYRYSVAVPQGNWSWVTSVDVSQAAPQFEVKDIVSPFGLMQDRIPIPSVVIQAMAQSIVDLQQNFAPTIVSSPSSLTFTLDQGRGFGDPQTVTVTNGGAYGSLLDASVTSSAAYMSVSPANVSSLAFNSSGTFAVAVDSTSLLSANSPYAATITLQDPNATNTPQVIPVTIIVRPLATISVSPSSLSFVATGATLGSFSPVPSQSFQVQNTGPSGSVLSYSIQKLTGLSPWLVAFSPSTGMLNSSASQTVTVVVQPPPGTLAGVYTETLRVSGYSSNAYQDVSVTLTVS